MIEEIHIEWTHEEFCPFSFRARKEVIKIPSIYIPNGEDEEGMREIPMPDHNLYISKEFDQNCIEKYKCSQRYLQPKEVADKLNELIRAVNSSVDNPTNSSKT